MLCVNVILVATATTIVTTTAVTVTTALPTGEYIYCTLYWMPPKYASCKH